MSDFTDYKHEHCPDHDVEVHITGVQLPGNKTSWIVRSDNMYPDKLSLATIFEDVAKVLRKESA